MEKRVKVNKKRRKEGKDFYENADIESKATSYISLFFFFFSLNFKRIKVPT